MDGQSIIDPKTLQRMADLISDIRQHRTIADMLTGKVYQSNRIGFSDDAPWVPMDKARIEHRQMLALIDYQEFVSHCRRVVSAADGVGNTYYS